MKIIRNNIIPVKGFSAMNLFGVIFARKNARLTKVTMNHEAIHTAQMKELLYIPFYIIYVIEYIYRLFTNSFDLNKAYRSISFEQEAYSNQKNMSYLSTRKKFSQWIAK